VLGLSGNMVGWDYTTPGMACDGSGGNCTGFHGGVNNWGAAAVWFMGYDGLRWQEDADAKSLSTLIRDGNYDFVTNSQKWHTTPATFSMPQSMYLPGKPAFFNTYSNTWPPYDPSNGAVHDNPAKTRYTNGTPNVP